MRSLYFLLRFFLGKPLRFVPAKSSSCFSLIDFAICFEAPFSEDFGRLPRFAARAAPAAICCFLDFAGIQNISQQHLRTVLPLVIPGALYFHCRRRSVVT